MDITGNSRSTQRGFVGNDHLRANAADARQVANAGQRSPNWSLSSPLANRRNGAGCSDENDDCDADEEVTSGWTVFVKEKLFWTLYVIICLGCAASATWLWMNKSPHVQRLVQLESIPIVSVLFTWAHIWLAVKMMFYPVKFKGLWQFRKSGFGLGWQGIVPRKAGIMAEKCCELMIGRLITMEEVVDRFQMDDFFQTLGDVLMECQRGVNERLGQTHFPSIWQRIPEQVKKEMLQKVLETSQISFNSVMADIRTNISSILNIKDMSVQHFTQNPVVLVDLFQHVGRKEFLFIQRCGAQMGLVLGLIQMGLYFITEDIKWMPWVLLPVSGLIIGNFTNWLAIKMIFRPVHPHYYLGGRLNVQGLFLKRQKFASKELARILTDTCLNADYMIQYLITSPGHEEAMEIFYRHTSNACDEVLGYAKSVVPIAVGNEKYDGLKKDAAGFLLEELPKHSSQFLKYTDQAFQIEELISSRLAALPPDQFEGMLHPAFEEDEWMLILLGGVLGVFMGLFQAAVLGS